MYDYPLNENFLENYDIAGINIKHNETEIIVSFSINNIYPATGIFYNKWNAILDTELDIIICNNNFIYNIKNIEIIKDIEYVYINYISDLKDIKYIIKSKKKYAKRKRNNLLLQY